MQSNFLQATHSFDVLTGDDLIDLLNNDANFHNKWFTLSERYIPSLFSVVDSYSRGQQEVAYHSKPGGLSYSIPEIHRVRMGDLVRNAQEAMTDLCFTRDAHSEAVAYFIEKTLEQIELGYIRLPVEVTAVLDALYDTDVTNVAQACRDTGKTRHAIKKLMDTYSADMYRRYRAVQQGQKYAMVMGDSAPFIQNCPRFTPLTTLGRDERDIAPNIVTEGDLVAELGSSLWYTVSNLGISGGLIFTEKGGILHLPVRHLSKQYREVASQFCSKIDVPR